MMRSTAGVWARADGSAQGAHDMILECFVAIILLCGVHLHACHIPLRRGRYYLA